MTPVAPWRLSGEVLASLVGWSPLASDELPDGLHRLPGPSLVVAARYDTSPVGPYLEFAVGAPARLGPRMGWFVHTMVVDSAESRRAGRSNWGFPKELGSLVWELRGRERALRWAERGIEVTGRPGHLVAPVLVPIRSLQNRGDGPVVVPGHLRGIGRLARITIDVPNDDPLAGLAGSHRGVHVAGMHFFVRPARHPVGLASTLRAPLRSPEPALSSPLWGD